MDLVFHKKQTKVQQLFSDFIRRSNCRPIFIETADGKEFVNKFFTHFLNEKNLKHIVVLKKAAIYAGRFIRTIRGLLKETIVEKNANWLDELSKVLKKYNNYILLSTKLTTKQASIPSNETEVNNNNRVKRRKKGQKFR